MPSCSVVRPSVWLVLWGVLFLGWPWGAARAADAPRNVILISIDTLRADRLGAYGYDRPTSPALDALASRGVRFETVVAESPWTLPSHMTMLTGRHPGAHGVTESIVKLPEAIPTLAETLQDQGYSTAGFTGGGNMRFRVGFDRGFDVYDDEKNDLATILAHARKQILERDPEKPFFLFLHTYDVHCPYDPPADKVAMFRTWGDEDSLPKLMHCGSWLRRAQAKNGVRVEPEKIRKYLSDMYDASIRAADEQLGAFFEFLDEQKILDDTLLVVTSDHGEAFHDGDRVGHAGQMNVEVLKIPMIVVAPGVEPTVLRQPVGLVDLAPTILDALGAAPLPADGQSVWPAIRDGKEGPDGWPRFSENDQDSLLRSAITKEHHLIWDLIEGDLTYYDLADDPGELSPRAGSTQDVALEQALRDHVEALIAVQAAARAARNQAPAPTAAISDAEAKRLKALGYLTD